MIKPSKTRKFAVSFISSILGIILLDLLFSRVLFVELFTNKDYGTRDRAIVIFVLSFISSIIITHIESKSAETKPSVGDYAVSWFFGSLVIFWIAGILAWLIQFIWRISSL